MLRWWLLCTLAAGCGRIWFDPLSNGDVGTHTDGGGSGDGSNAVDGAMSAPGVCGTTVQLVDDFEDTVTGAAWTQLNGTNLTLTESGGLFNIAFGTNVPSNQEAGYLQTTAMDYTGACMTAELVSIPSATATGRLEVRVEMGTSTYVLFAVLTGTLHAFSNDGVTQIHPAMQPWSATNHRFLRIRETSGTWYWETSADNVVYTIFAETTQAHPTTAALRLRVTTSAGVSNGGTVQFAGVTVLGH